MGGDSIENSVRYVVSSRHAGGILPGKQAEMWRDVYLRPGAEVEGGIFGNRLHVEGQPIRVSGAVYLREAIEITFRPGEAPGQGGVEFGSAVTTADSILIDDQCPHRTRFRADVTANQARIRNAFVCGNLFVHNGFVQDSVVLGGIFCTGSLSLGNVVVGTFRAKRAELKPGVTLLYPFAVAEEPIAMDFPVRTLSFASLDDLLRDASDTGGGAVCLDGQDVVEVTEPAEDAPRTLRMISLGARILDMEKVKARILDNRRILEELALGDHLAPHARHHFARGALADAEEALFRMLRRPVPERAIEKSALAEVKERASVREFLAGRG